MQARLTRRQSPELLGTRESTKTIEESLDEVHMRLRERRVNPDAARRDPMPRRSLDTKQLDRIGLLRLQQPRIELAMLRARASLANDTQPIDERVRVARSLADELVKTIRVVPMPWLDRSTRNTYGSAGSSGYSGRPRYSRGRPRRIRRPKRTKY